MTILISMVKKTSIPMLARCWKKINKEIKENGDSCQQSVDIGGHFNQCKREAVSFLSF